MYTHSLARISILSYEEGYTLRFFLTVALATAFFFLLPSYTDANNTEQLRNTYYFLDDYYSSNVQNVPQVHNSLNLRDRVGDEWATSTFNFSTPLPHHEIDDDGWYMYIVYLSETADTAIGYGYSGSSGGSSSWYHGGPYGIAEKEVDNLWIQMMEGSCLIQHSFSGECSQSSTTTLDKWYVRNVGCNNFCREPIGVVFSKYDASNEINNATTDQDIYNIITRLIQRNQQYTVTDIVATTTWSNTGVPYIISGDITIDQGVTLTIEPGVTVLFDTSTSSSITVEGSLIAEGELNTNGSIDYVTFTSAVNPSTEGDWGGIIIESTGKAQFDYVVISYGGASNSNNSQIYNNGGDLMLDDSKVIFGTTYGIRNVSGTAEVTGTEIAYNDYGFYLSNGMATITANNILHENYLYGIYNDSSSTTINAIDNYWGDETGPYNNPNNVLGTNNAVSSNVLFHPWTEGLAFQNINSSVNGNEIKWAGSTEYDVEFANAVATWNSLASVTIATGTIFVDEDLRVSDVDESDLPWVGEWSNDPDPFGFDTLRLNKYYMDQVSFDMRQHTITHELGHALGLLHSFLGNIMYYRQTSQTTLGNQDLIDYDALH